MDCAYKTPWSLCNSYEKKFIFLQHGVTYLKAHQQNSPYGKGKEAEPYYMVVGSEKEMDLRFIMKTNVC